MGKYFVLFGVILGFRESIFAEISVENQRGEMTFILSKDYALGVEIWIFGIGIFWVFWRFLELRMILGVWDVREIV